MTRSPLLASLLAALLFLVPLTPMAHADTPTATPIGSPSPTGTPPTATPSPTGTPPTATATKSPATPTAPVVAATATTVPAATSTAVPAPPTNTPAPTATFVPDVAADTTIVAMTTIPIPGASGKGPLSSDIVDIDQETHLMYIADRTTGGVDVFDVTTPPARFVTTIKTPSPANGVIIAKNVNRVVAGLNDSSVVSIDMSTNQIVGSVNTGGQKRADEVDYDPIHKKIYMANSDDAIVSVIDMNTFTIIKKFDSLGAGLEQPRFSPADGMVYVTGAGTDSLYQIDAATDTLVQRIGMPTKCSPSGLWMNPKTNVGVIMCAPAPIIWDFNSQKQVGTLSQANKGDQAFYDPKTDLYIWGASTGNPHGPHVAIVGGTPIRFITNIPVASVHNVVLDNRNNYVYAIGRGEALYGFPLPASVLAAVGSNILVPAALPASGDSGLPAGAFFGSVLALMALGALLRRRFTRA